MAKTVVLERPGRQVQSYATGRHLPNPYETREHVTVWRCRDCGQKLRAYFFATRDEWRLRHDPRLAPDA